MAVKLYGYQHNAELQRLADAINTLTDEIEALKASQKPVKRARKAKVAKDT